MKRAELIEWGIIVIALIFGYKFLEGIITLIIQIIYGFDNTLIMSDMLRFIVIIGLYAAFFIVLIKFAGKIAEAISPPPSSADDPAIKIGKRSMLQVILIAICSITILSNIADIIYYIFDAFRSSAGRRGFTDPPTSYLPGPYQLTVKIIQLFIAVIVIIASKNICELLVRKDEADELVFDSKPEK